MKKNSSKTIFLTVLGVGVVALLAVYMLVFQKYNDKTDRLKTENVTLRQENNKMQKYYLEMGTNLQLTEEFKAEALKIMDEYPVDAREEDMLMMAVDMQSVSEMKTDEILIEKAELLYTVSREDLAVVGMELPENQGQVEFMERKVTYNSILSYDDLKKCIQQIYATPGVISIHNVVLTKEETVEGSEDEIIVRSNLTGNIDVSFYSLAGTGKEYTAPEMEEYVVGTTNPFKLVYDSKKAAEEAE